MSARDDWMPLNQAAELLSAARVREARIELVDEMTAGRLIARAERWTEEGAPATIRHRTLPIVLSDGTTQIPPDFWLRGHAFDGSHHTPVSYSTTEADWELLRFRMIYAVDGGRPGWPDRWGPGITDHGWKTWAWTRVAIGVNVDANVVSALLNAYALGRKHRRMDSLTHYAPTTRGWAFSDKPLVERGIAMITAGTAKSPNDAARKLAPETQGYGGIASTVDRLGRRIRERLKSLGDIPKPL